MTRSTLLHLRIPFSFYLLPVFLFAFAISESFEWIDFVLVAIALHLFLYPASNGYNSYFDKDEQSIGGLEHPPEVKIELYTYALIFDGAALVLGYFISWQFVAMLFIYGLASKAYSHPSVRLKKLPFVGWLIAGYFQGYFTFLMAYIGINHCDISDTFIAEIQFPALLSSILLWGSYPMTQIYQHDEDRRRGDFTISLKLGVLGTFHFTAVVFSAATAGFVFFFYQYFSLEAALVYMACMGPILFFFGKWYIKARKDITTVNFKNAMSLNFVSALMLNIFFLILGLALIP